MDVAAHNSRLSQLTKIFKAALIAKGQIAAAPDYYMSNWIQSSIELNAESMEEII